MALTEATHHRLHHRAAEGQTQFSRGIYTIGEFSGLIRCLESTHNGALVWTGEADGSLAVRRGVSGETIALIRGRPGAFPTVIHAVRSHVWVGFSDGFIHVYSPSEPFPLLASSKGHAGAVTAITSHHGRVLTGSEDRIIKVWDGTSWDVQRPTDPHTPSLRPIAKLVEAKHAITAIAASAGVAYAGTTDGTIYAWDLASLVANTDVFPIAAHRGAVTALVARGACIISAGDDGAVRIISTQSGQTLRLMHAHRGPVVDIAVDDAAGRIYSAGRDGDILVLDAATGRQVASFTDARVSSIKALRGVGSVATTRLWVAAADGTIRVLSSDVATDVATAQGADAMDARVDGLRAVLQQVNSDVARQAALLESLQGAGRKRRHVIARNLAVAVARGRAVDALSRLLSWYSQQRLRQRREILAAALARQHQLAAAGRAFRTWVLWWARHHRAGGADGAVDMLVDQRESAATASALTALREVAAERAAARFRQRVAAALAQRSTRAVLERYFASWSEFAVGRGRRARLSAAAPALTQPTLPRGVLSEAYHRLATAARAHASTVHKERLASALAEAANARVVRRYYYALLQFALRKRRVRTFAQVTAVASATASATYRAADSELLARKAFATWLRFRDLRALQRSERVLAAYAERDGALAARTAPSARDVSLVEARCEELADAIGALEGRASDEVKARDVLYMVNFQLKQEAAAAAAASAALAGTSAADSVSAARSARDDRSGSVLQLLMSLKARAVNLHDDYPIVKATMEAVAAHPKGRTAGVQARYWQAFDAIAAIAARHTTNPPGAEDSTPVYVWDPAQLGAAALSLAEARAVLRHAKELVCAWDVAAPTVAQSLHSHPACVEAANGLAQLLSRAVETVARSAVNPPPQARTASPPPPVGGRARDGRPVWR